jgi:hypothetical protein
MKKLIAVLAIAAFAVAANAHCGKCEGDKKDHKCAEACKDKCKAEHKCTDACKDKCKDAHKDDKKK